MTSAPLTVINALVQRADSSPAAAGRAARPRYNVNRAGEGVEEPDTADRTLALSSEPQLEWEAYDEYWRKVHGPKILHAEGPEDRQTPLLQYYLQQHRLPAGPSSEQAPPYSARPGTDGRLVRDPAARCEPPLRPAFDGLAQLAYRSKQDLESFFDVGPGKYGEKIVPDEAVFLRGFAFHVAEEHVVIEGDGRRDPVILIRLHVRQPALSRAEFRGRWMAQHAELLRGLPATRRFVRRYAQLVNVSAAGDRLYDPAGDRYDGLGVLSFANMNDCEDFLGSEDYARLRTDEGEFAAETTFFTAINFVIRDAT